MVQNDKITLIELIDFHYYFYLMNDFDSLRITSEKIVEESNLIRLENQLIQGPRFYLVCSTQLAY